MPKVEIEKEETFTIDKEETFTIDMDEGVYDLNAKIDTGKSPVPIVTWTNRRRMAWISLITFLVVGVYLIGFASQERVAAVETVYYYLVLGCGTVIAAYVGFTSLPFIGKSK